MQSFLPSTLDERKDQLAASFHNRHFSVSQCERSLPVLFDVFHRAALRAGPFGSATNSELTFLANRCSVSMVPVRRPRSHDPWDDLNAGDDRSWRENAMQAAYGLLESFLDRLDL